MGIPMPKRSVVFTAQQFAYLEAEAERLGLSVSELVRRIVDQFRDKETKS